MTEFRHRNTKYFKQDMDKKIALGFDLRLLECLAFSVFGVFLTSILFIRSKDAEFREKRQ